MKAISDILTWVFTYLFYPTIVIGLFVYVIATTGAIVRSGRNASAVARRLTGTLLPLVVLIFIVVSEQAEPSGFVIAMESQSVTLGFVWGAVTGIILMEAGKRLLSSDSEVGPSLYSLFLSTVAVFVLYSIMMGFLRALHVPLLGLVLASGLDIVFRGPPTVD